MSEPTGAGNYPAGVTDNDPHFDLPSVDDYCSVDGFPLNEDSECDQCLQSAASEQAIEDSEDMEWEA